VSQINGTDLVISSVGRWHPGDLAFIESLEYTAKLDDKEAELVLVGVFQRRDSVRDGWPSKEERRFRVKLRFLGVQHLYVLDFGGAPTQISGFDIIPISERGLEGIRFSVEDYEDDRIRFLCDRIEIVSVLAI
jgi:hypothetical protein